MLPSDLLTNIFAVVEAQRTQAPAAEAFAEAVVFGAGRDRDRDRRGVVRDDEAASGTFQARNSGHRFNQV